MIKTVLFDLGNVILPFDLARFAQQLSAYSPLSINEIMERIGPKDVVDAFESGLMSADDYFQYLCSSCQLDGLSFEEFVPMFNDIFDENQDVIDLIGGLKGRVHLGLISNTNPIHVEHLRKSFGHLGRFDRIWFSNESGYRKPNPAIYSIALNHFNVKPHESVFIDDMQPNVESARDLGINAIQFTDSKKLRSELIKLGVKI